MVAVHASKDGFPDKGGEVRVPIGVKKAVAKRVLLAKGGEGMRVEGVIELP